jgi:hypothetical protein
MVDEKRLNHENVMRKQLEKRQLSRQETESERQSEDATSLSIKAGSDEVIYDDAPTASMRSGSAFSSAQSPVFRSDVCALRALIR